VLSEVTHLLFLFSVILLNLSPFFCLSGFLPLLCSGNVKGTVRSESKVIVYSPLIYCVQQSFKIVLLCWIYSLNQLICFTIGLVYKWDLSSL